MIARTHTAVNFQKRFFLTGCGVFGKSIFQSLAGVFVFDKIKKSPNLLIFGKTYGTEESRYRKLAAAIDFNSNYIIFGNGKFEPRATNWANFATIKHFAGCRV